MDIKVKQLQRQCKKWEQKYNLLLQKNQNDLIKIRLREKQLNETIGKLQSEKQQIKNQLGRRIQALMKEINNLNEKINETKLSKKVLHDGKQKIEFSNKQLQANDQSKMMEQNQKLVEQCQKLKQLNSQLTSKIKILDVQYKAIAQSNSQFMKSQGNTSAQTQLKNRQLLEKQNAQIDELTNKLTQAQSNLKDSREQTNNLKTIIKQYEVKAQQHQQQTKKSHQMNQTKKTFHISEQLVLQSQIDRLKQFLTLANTQYKNLAHKEQLKQELIQSKNQELNVLTQQIINLQQKIEKLKESENYKLKFHDQQRQKQQAQQENLLLKQMINSHKTMMKIKENQIQRLKNKIAEQQNLQKLSPTKK